MESLISHKKKGMIVPYSIKNTAILERLERDVAKLQSDIDTLNKNISFILEYTKVKKEREDNRWF